MQNGWLIIFNQEWVININWVRFKKNEFIIFLIITTMEVSQEEIQANIQKLR